MRTPVHRPQPDAAASPPPEDAQTSMLAGESTADPQAPAAQPTAPDSGAPEAPATPEGPADDIDHEDNAKLDLMRTRAARAEAIRTEHKYKGVLTVPLLVALQGLLGDPTPKKYVRRVPCTTTKDYVSTGLTGIQYQIEYCNDVFTIAHWRWLIAYQAEGTVAHAYVVIGNNLAAIKLDSQGELIIPDSAEVLVQRDGWGGHTTEAKMGDRLKSGMTNALKRVLAELGIAGDVYRLDVEAGELLQVPEHLLAGGGHQATQNGSSRQRPPRPTTPPSTNGSRPVATAAQLDMVRRHADRQGLTPSAFANALRAVHSLNPTRYATDADAQQVLDLQLPKLPRRLVQPLLQLIKSTNAPAVAGPETTPAAHAAAPAAAPTTPGAPTTGADSGKAQLLAQHARAYGLTATALALLIDQVHDRPQRTFTTAADAVAAVAAELPALDDALVVPLAELIAASQTGDGDSTAAPPAPAAPPAGRPPQNLVPFDPTAVQAA